MSRNQSEVFAQSEADAWFRRNKAAIAAASTVDWGEQLIDRLGDKNRLRRVCDIGCSNGWRLNALQRVLPDATELHGVDPSKEAIADGQKRFPDLALRTGLLPDTGIEGVFDLVLVRFVLHWVDRTDLARSVAEIDRLVDDGGYLLISDFLPERPSKRAYHHLAGSGIHTYKQDYAAIFTSLGLYREVARITFGHTRSEGTDPLALGAVSEDDRCVSVLLSKSSEYYA